MSSFDQTDCCVEYRPLVVHRDGVKGCNSVGQHWDTVDEDYGCALCAKRVKIADFLLVRKDQRTVNTAGPQGIEKLRPRYEPSGLVRVEQTTVRKPAAASSRSAPVA